jgi:lipoyl(octanoyl) transferase
MIPFVDYTDLGLKEYKAAWDYQEEIHKQALSLRDGQVNMAKAGVLLFCEHPHVFTMGKSGEQNNLLVNEEFLKKINATYYQSNRGGDITYHGPGQIVGYPIFDLEKLKIGVKQYVHLLEEVIILTLSACYIQASRLNGATGVWIDSGSPKARKICAIGVRVSKAVTMHGFALNVNTDLSYFSYINPCGFQDKGVTSIQKEMGSIIGLDEVKKLLIRNTEEVFKLQVRVAG